MLVSIGGVFMFDADTWTTVSAFTWQDISTYTWQEIANFQQNGLLKLEPNPSIHHAIEDVSTAEFSIRDIGANYHFRKGEEIICYSSSDFTVIFGGYIDLVKETISSSYNVITHDITAIDYHYLSNKRIVAKAWQNTTIDTAVEWVLNEILADEGVTEGNIQSSVTLTEYTADYISATECLDQLAEFAGFTWWISTDKKLYFVDRSTYSASWNLEENTSHVITDALSGTLSVVHGNPEYRNKQYLKGGKAKTAAQTEYFIGDGSQQTFVIGYELAEAPTISMKTGEGEYVSQTVGIKGSEDDKQWYWSKNDNSIVQELTDTALTNIQTLKIVYYGLYPIVAVSADFAEILLRQNVEGTDSSGIVEMVSSDQNITSMDSALERVNATLSHYASIGKKIEYETTRSGLNAGTLQHITISSHDVDNDCLIGSVDIKFNNTYDYYTISAYTGPVEDNWTKLFLKISEAQRAVIAGQSTSNVILILQEFTKNWTYEETPNIWREVTADGTCLPGNIDFPCFADDDKIKYLALYYNNDEMYRVYRTQQTLFSTQITTTFFIPSNAANQVWEEAKLIGGDNATTTPYSGTIVETHVWNYTKNSLESLQMQFISNKYTS